jgi:CHAD domain-containing protein
MSGRSELLIRQRLVALRRSLPGARHGSLTAVHQARVATRRLREALPLVARGGKGRKLERRVRNITRALGPVRELDVALLMLDEFEGSGAATQAGLQALRQAMAEERRRLHDGLLRELGDAGIEKLEKRAIAAARERDARATASRSRDPRAREAADKRAARRAERLRTAIERAASMYLPDRLHDVRIAVKRLRYAMEIAREVRGARSRTAGSSEHPTRGAAAAIRTLKRAQDLLGRMHDLEVLIARTRAVQGSSRAPSLRVSAELDGFVRRLETECRQLHARHLASRQTLLAICAEAVAKTLQHRSAA